MTESVQQSREAGTADTPPSALESTAGAGLAAEPREATSDDGAIHQAIDRTTNANDLVGALRSKAFRDFAIGRVDEGRTLFSRAMDVFTRFPNGSAGYVQYTHLQTQLGWAQTELFVHACGEARTHLAAAEGYTAGVSQADSRVQQLRQLAPLVAACVPGASPSSGTLPSLPPAS